MVTAMTDEPVPAHPAQLRSRRLYVMWGIAVFALVCSLGCSPDDWSGTVRTPATGPKPPVSKRLIVRDPADPKGRPLFLGRDGKKRIKAKWPVGVLDIRISPLGKCAVGLVTDSAGGNPHLVFYDPDGKQVANEIVPTKAPPRQREIRFWPGDCLAAIVHVIEYHPRPHEMARPKVKGEIGLCIGVGKKTKKLVSGNIATVLLLSTHGFVVAAEHKGKWLLARYDRSGTVVWKKNFVLYSRHARPNLLLRKEGGTEFILDLPREGLFDVADDGTVTKNKDIQHGVKELKSSR
jgi:hypothetical protein